MAIQQFGNTDGKLYIVELTPPYTELAIQFYPEEIPEQRKVLSQDTGVVGYNNSGTNYTGGDNIINLKLDFYADENAPQAALKKAEWLKSLGYSNGFTKGQPIVMLIWGTVFKGRKWQVVNAVDINMKGFRKNYNTSKLSMSGVTVKQVADISALVPPNNMPSIITVSITFKEIVDKASTLSDIRQQRTLP